MPIASRQFMMVLNSQFHTHTLTMTSYKRKIHVLKYCPTFVTTISDSPRSEIKLTHYIKVFSDYLRVTNEEKNEKT